MTMMELPDLPLDIVDRAPFTPIAGNNDGMVRDFHGHVVADTGGNESMAEAIARLLNSASLYMR